MGSITGWLFTSGANDIVGATLHSLTLNMSPYATGLSPNLIPNIVESLNVLGIRGIEPGASPTLESVETNC